MTGPRVQRWGRSGPRVLLVHGSDDAVVPATHLERLAAVRRTTDHPLETLVIDGGQHSWLYEYPAYRRTVAAFLARALGGPLSPDEAAARGGAVGARRLPDTVRPPTQIEQEPGGFRSLSQLARPRRRGGRENDGQGDRPAGDPADGEAIGTELVG